MKLLFDQNLSSSCVYCERFEAIALRETKQV